MLKLKKKKPVISPLMIIAGITCAAIFWIILQAALPSLLESVYFRFFLLCFLGFGFLVISFLLKYT